MRNSAVKKIADLEAMVQSPGRLKNSGLNLYGPSGCVRAG